MDAGSPAKSKLRNQLQLLYEVHFLIEKDTANKNEKKNIEAKGNNN